MICSITNLKPDALARIQNLEKQLDQTLVALTVQSIELSDPADDIIKQIRQVEDELGVVLLAVK